MTDAERKHLKIELYRLTVARSDVAEAWNACELLLKRVKGMGDALYAPIYHAAVVAYARPFTANKPFGPLPARWSRFSSRRLQKLHETVLEDRNTFVAHSDADVREVSVVPPSYLMPSGKSGGLTVQILTTYRAPDYFLALHEATVELSERFSERINELLDQLYGSGDLPLEPFALTFDNDF
jgi:hypothetical protein